MDGVTHTSLLGLNDALSGLPPVANGKVRVFRGQTVDYPTIIPAAYRNHLERSAIWSFYSRHLLLDTTKKPFDSEDIEGEGQTWGLWLQAIAQHYASGSRYLDVTHSIESAAWFALHSGEWMTERSILGPPGPPSPYDLPGEVKWLRYSRTSEPGFLFAFDVDRWNKTDALPPSLSLIDLSEAPPPLCTPRMLAQAGCLILTGDDDQHDLRRYRVVGTPLRIGWPLTGSEFVNRTVEEMFPSPQVDNWYRRFLSIPMTPDIDASGGVVLKRPLPVTLYRGESDAYNDTVSATEKFLYPPLLHRSLKQLGVQRRASAVEWWRGVSVESATPIVLEAPLLKAFAPAGSHFWNHQLLFSDMSDSVQTYSYSKQATSHSAWQRQEDVSVQSVLFQFSLCEEVFWEHAEEGHTQTLLRGVWIARNGEEILVFLLLQEFPGTQVAGLGPILIRLDDSSMRMVCKPAEEKAEWVKLATLPELAKPVFVGLYLLRALSLQLKAEAVATTTLVEHRAGGDHYKYLVRVFADAGRLIRIADPARLADWFVLRDHEGEPYTEAKTCLDLIPLEDTRPYIDIPISVFRATILALLASKKP